MRFSLTDYRFVWRALLAELVVSIVVDAIWDYPWWGSEIFGALAILTVLSLAVTSFRAARAERGRPFVVGYLLGIAALLSVLVIIWFIPRLIWVIFILGAAWIFSPHYLVAPDVRSDLGRGLLSSGGARSARRNRRRRFRSATARLRLSAMLLAKLAK